MRYVGLYIGEPERTAALDDALTSYQRGTIVDLPSYFTVPLSQDGTAPATHYGALDTSDMTDEELEAWAAESEERGYRVLIEDPMLHDWRDRSQTPRILWYQWIDDIQLARVEP